MDSGKFNEAFIQNAAVILLNNQSASSQCHVDLGSLGRLRNTKIDCRILLRSTLDRGFARFLYNFFILRSLQPPKQPFPKFKATSKSKNWYKIDRGRVCKKLSLLKVHGYLLNMYTYKNLTATTIQVFSYSFLNSFRGQNLLIINSFLP